MHVAFLLLFLVVPSFAAKKIGLGQLQWGTRMNNQEDNSETGSQTGSEESASVTECEAPKPIGSSVVLGNQKSFGSKAKYMCYRGGKLIGSSIVTCLRNGSWSNDYQFTCPWCSDPPPVQGAKQVNIQSTGVPIATYECQCPQPYSQTLSGTPIAACTQDGWEVQFTCNADCYIDSRNYRGEKNTTQTGFPCQPWVANSPHSHIYHRDDMFPDSSVSEAGNKCRDPDNEGAPWCYTMSTELRFDFCGVPHCSNCFHYYWRHENGTFKECSAPPYVLHARQINIRTADVTIARYECTCPQPYNQTLFGTPTLTCTKDGWDVQFSCSADCYTVSTNYLGERNTTRDGIPCQQWVEDFPHVHVFHNDDMFPDSSVSVASNKCRDPFGEGLPWCFTMSTGITWDKCGVPHCSDCHNSVPFEN